MEAFASRVRAVPDRSQDGEPQGRRTPVRRANPRVRPKLQVGPSDDRLEREADEVAASVLAALDSTVPVTHDALGSPHQWPSRVRRSSVVGSAGGNVDGETAERIVRAGRGGSPLAAPVRSQMEAAFGTDLGRVRVHCGPEVADLNDRIGAQAFTMGSQVFFRDGLPDVARPAGRHLLAHELAHTVQQGGASPSRIQRKVGFEFEVPSG
jgi:hypothetical protein